MTHLNFLEAAPSTLLEGKAPDTNYTPIPWKKGEPALGRAAFIYAGEPDGGESFVAIADVDAPDGQGESGIGAGNARRMLAAVNSCGCIPTQALEADVISRLIAACKPMLKDIDGTGEDICWCLPAGDDGVSSTCEACQLRAVVAEATGEPL